MYNGIRATLVRVIILSMGRMFCKTRRIVFCVAACSLFFVFASTASAGTLVPPSGTTTATSYTTGDIFTRLTTNAAATFGNHILSSLSSPAATHHTFTELYNAIPTIDPTKLLNDTTYFGVTGMIPIQTLSATSNTMLAGYYSTTTFTAVNPDLNPNNIRTGVNLFGVVGDYSAPTFPDTSDATAHANEILQPKTGYVNGAKLTGTMPLGALSSATDTVSNGYYASTTLHEVDPDLIADNIRSGVTLFGIPGTYAGYGYIYGDNIPQTVLTTAAGPGTYDATHLSSSTVLASTTFGDGEIGAVIQSLGNAVAENVVAGKTFSNATSSKIFGTMSLAAISSTTDEVLAGYYASTTLHDVDPDFISQNIKGGVSIFGIPGLLGSYLFGDNNPDQVLTTAAAPG